MLLKKSFCTGDQKFSGRRRDFRVKMWGTSSPSEKLTGDFANGLGAILIGELSLASLFSKKSSPGILGLLQQNLPQADSCTAANSTLLDHLVGDGEHPWRHLDAERSRRLKVDDELEFGRLQHRQVGGLGALEDAAGMDADLTKHFCEIGSVAHQPAGCHKITDRISRRDPVARRQGGNLHAAGGQECVASDEEGIGAL